MIHNLNKEAFSHLESVVSSERFLKKEGLGNEVPFFIYPYDPKETNNLYQNLKQFKKKLGNSGTEILDINLFDLSIEILRKRGIWDEIIQTEQSVSKEELKELLQGVLDSEQHLIPAISEKMESTPFQVLFITGIGEVFPYIRSHNVLNNLQRVAKEKPTVMFFPGSYTHSLETGAALKLFNLLEDDKYYRAFNILDYKV